MIVVSAQLSNSRAAPQVHSNTAAVTLIAERVRTRYSERHALRRLHSRHCEANRARGVATRVRNKDRDNASGVPQQTYLNQAVFRNNQSHRPQQSCARVATKIAKSKQHLSEPTQKLNDRTNNRCSHASTRSVPSGASTQRRSAALVCIYPNSRPGVGTT